MVIGVVRGRNEQVPGVVRTAVRVVPQVVIPGTDHPSLVVRPIDLEEDFVVIGHVAVGVQVDRDELDARAGLSVSASGVTDEVGATRGGLSRDLVQIRRLRHVDSGHVLFISHL